MMFLFIGLQEFLTYVASLTFDEKPDYENCRNILREGLVERGYKDDGKLVFMSATPKPISKKPKSRLKVSSSGDDDRDLSGSPVPTRRRKLTAARQGSASAVSSAPSSSSGSSSGTTGRRQQIVAKPVDTSTDMFADSDPEDTVMLSDDRSSDFEPEVMPVKVVKRGAPRDRATATAPAAVKRRRIANARRDDDSVEDENYVTARDASPSSDPGKENSGTPRLCKDTSQRADDKKSPRASNSRLVVSKVKKTTRTLKSSLSKPSSKSPIVKAKARSAVRVGKATTGAGEVLSSLDNPTPAMLELIAKRNAKLAAVAGKRKKH